MSEQCAELSKAKKKENCNSKSVKTWGMREAITCLVTNQIFVFALVPHWTKEKRKQKGKARTTKAKSPTKIQLPKSPVDPWLHILSLIWWEMTYKVESWHICGLELGWNAYMCEILYTLSSFPLFDWTQCFLLMLFRKWIRMSQISFVVMRNSISMLSFPSSHIFFFKNICCSDWFGGLFLC